MSTDPTSRQPKGIPAGGQFAATSHSDPDIALSSAADHQAVLAEMGAAARAAISHSSAKNIAELLKNSPDSVYDDNVATLAASNACTYEDIHGINRVFNDGYRPLHFTGTGDDLTDQLAAGGLTGNLVPYTGSNPDIPDDAWTYTSDAGRELVLSRTEEGGFMVWNEDRDEDFSFRLETSPGYVTPETCVDSVRESLWTVAVTDANDNMPDGLRSGDFYELRELCLDKDADGDTFGEIMASNDDGMWTRLRHDFKSGATTVDRDGERLEGDAADWEMAAVFEGLHSEPTNGDFHTHAKAFFGALLAESAKDPDAPGWAARIADQEHTR